MRTALAVIATLAIASPAAAQIDWEFEAAAGYTVVDLDAVAANDGASLNDWNQPSFRGAARAFLGGSFGVEVAYQSLYWYAVRISNGITPYNREYQVNTTTAMGLLRLGGGSTTVDVGGGLSFFEDGPVPALSLGLGFPIAGSLSGKFRVDGLMTDEPTLPVAFGLSYSPGQ